MIEIERKFFIKDYNKLHTYLTNNTIFNYTECQLNHYFEGTLDNLLKLKLDIESPEQYNSFSVRTRATYKNNTDVNYLFVKLSKDGDANAQGSRKEYEFEYTCTIKQLDQLLLKYGFKELSKWNRIRQEYVDIIINTDDTIFTYHLDNNSGYGKILEIETIVAEGENDKDRILKEIESKESELGLELVDPKLLKEYFNYYNANWEWYYTGDLLTKNENNIYSFPIKTFTSEINE